MPATIMTPSSNENRTSSTVDTTSTATAAIVEATMPANAPTRSASLEDRLNRSPGG